MLHEMNVAVKSRVNAITTRHLNKLNNLCNKRSTSNSNNNHRSFLKTTASNTSSYNVTEDAYNALVFILHHHILKRTNKNVIETEFERYFQSINYYVNDIPDNKITQLKTKLRNICDRYNRIRVSYKFRKIAGKLSRNNSIMVLT